MTKKYVIYVAIYRNKYYVIEYFYFYNMQIKTVLHNKYNYTMNTS